MSILAKRIGELTPFLELTLCLIFAASLPLSAQVDPNVGPQLTNELHTLIERTKIDNKAHNSVFHAGNLWNSVDFELTRKNLLLCEQVQYEIQMNINAFNFDRAKNQLRTCNDDLNALETILQEDSSQLSLLMIKSKKETLTPPKQQMPVGDGLRTRAIIYNEINYAERMSKRANVPMDGIYPGEVGTPCTKERESFSQDLIGPNDSLTVARDKLRHLNYAEAHEIAWKVYSESQHIIAICESQDRRIRPWQFPK